MEAEGTAWLKQNLNNDIEQLHMMTLQLKSESANVQEQLPSQQVASRKVTAEKKNTATGTVKQIKWRSNIEIDYVLDFRSNRQPRCD